ncbi:DUF2799 domain-containing protein [Ruegeria atlantica]|uniref:DUF2799 domain-containing protein n=1 Tax=Ruegeria atlantica TaxID=81569 RepID=UPI001480043D|nr:DUF2799 domain-containing protein [Ruegeria atlantica]
MKNKHSLTTTRKQPLKLGISIRSSALLMSLIAICLSSGHSASAGEGPPGLFSRLFQPETCTAKIDWSEVGLSDGRLGVERSYFGVYEKLCARRSRTPDKQAYFQAYRIGIKSYCDPENIYRLARTGAVAIGACEETPAILNAVQNGFANIRD